jgi:hypothetical protein
VCVNSASTVLRGAGANGGDKMETAEHEVAACGKALIKDSLSMHSLFLSEKPVYSTTMLIYILSPELLSSESGCRKNH